MAKRLQIALYLLLLWIFPVRAYGQIANLVSSVSAINQSMGGAATAMPLDAAGAQYWNPAGITDLPTTEADLNIQPFFPKINMDTSLQIDHPGGQPPTILAGNLQSDAKVEVLPTFAFVKNVEQSPWRWGILITGSGGAAVKFNHKGSEPLTAPPPIGSGNIKIIGQFLQVSPTLARRISPHWSIGVQPNFNLTSFKAQPNSGVAPADFNEDGIPTYPRTQRAWSEGIGVQGGVYYHNPQNGIHLGSSIKSTQWFLPYQLKNTYYLETREKKDSTLVTDLPMIVSVGVGYSGIPKWKFTTDARYVNFANTKGTDQVGFRPDGSIRGPGWRNIWAIASGVQYQATEKFSVRTGYAYNQSPVKSINTAFAIGSPSVIQHSVSAGFSYQFNPHMAFAAAYEYAFAGSSTGPLQSLNGPIPNSSINLKTSLNSFVVGLIVKF